MSWWRKKQEHDEDKDNILDLDTVVWRGIAPEERLERLAASAQQEEDIKEGIIPEPIKNNYVPTKPLPTVPLPVQHVTRFVEEEPQDLEQDLETETTLDEDVLPQRALTAEEEMIEADIREQIMAEIAAEIEAELEAETRSAPVLEEDEQEETINQPPAQAMTPDVSEAIKNIVADEIGGWLNHNVQRIIAETVSSSLTDARPQEEPKEAEPPKTEPKTKPKTAAKKTSAKATAKSAAKKKSASSTAKKTSAKKASAKKAKKASSSSQKASKSPKTSK